MKKLAIVAAAALAFCACKKDGDENTTKVTTEEVTQVDTVNGQEKTTSVVTETTKTDSTEVSISTGAVETKAVDTKASSE